MSSASMVVFFDGAPAVSARFWSKSLKELVSVRNVQMVMEGHAHRQRHVGQPLPAVGAVHRRRVVQFRGMDCMPAM